MKQNSHECVECKSALRTGLEQRRGVCTDCTRTYFQK